MDLVTPSAGLVFWSTLNLIFWVIVIAWIVRLVIKRVGS